MEEEIKKREPRFHGEATEKSHKKMSKIKGKDTRIEVSFRRALWENGIRYRKNYKQLPGSPDIVLTKYKIAIFCDSEFFHGKDWPELQRKLAKGKNGDYWLKKIARNIERDKEKDDSLRFLGWTVLHFWGDEIRNNIEECIKTVKETIFMIKMDRLDSEED